MTTGPRVGSSSVAWETPDGVITSTAFGTVDGLTEQIGAVPPGGSCNDLRAGANGVPALGTPHATRTASKSVPT